MPTLPGFSTFLEHVRWQVVLSPVESEKLQLEFPSVRTLWVVLAALPHG